MRAKSINEDINSILSPKFGTDIEASRLFIINEYKKSYERIFYFFENIIKDTQLNKDSDDFIGFINISYGDFGDPKMNDVFKEIVEIFKGFTNPKRAFIDALMKDLKLIFEHVPTLEETIIASE
jgi:hypothetical protein